MIVETTKVDAGIRQLDVAIDLLFQDRDPLAVRTLAAAALTVLSDLVEKRNPGSSWRETVIADSKLPRKDVLRVMNEAANFLKHADRDVSDSLSFEETENDDVIFIASLDCGELGAQLSMRIQAFQIWFIATRPDLFADEPRLGAAHKVFPGIDKLDRRIQLTRGRAFIQQVKNSAASKQNA